MKKSKFTKENIIDIAFKEWGKKNFINKSLTLITRKMNITKPALYRYFKNKEELFNSMKMHLISKLSDIHDIFIEESKNKSVNEIIYLFIKIQFEFFLNNYNYFIFHLFYLIKQDLFCTEVSKKINSDLNEILKSIFIKSDSWIKPENANHALIYIYSTGFFFLLDTFNDKNNKSLDKEQIKSIIDNIYFVVMNGFGYKTTNYEVDFDKIENNNFIKSNTINKNKIFDAISYVVAEEGVWETTISKIANKLNMSKSSLYSHHKNKNEMLQSMIIEEIKNRINFTNQNIKLFDNDLEKIYCYITSLSYYLLNNKKIMHVFDWVHIQKVDVKSYIVKNKINFNDEFQKNISVFYKNKIININHFNDDFIYNFLTMQIVKEIYFAELIGREISLNDMRLVYNFFLKGLNLGG